MIIATGPDVIRYRGAPVGSRDGWIADAKSRGGTITRIGSGFWEGVEAARFGSSSPYVYELPPLWLLLWNVPDDAADAINREFGQTIAEAAENQLQDLANIGNAATNIGNGIIAGLPALLYLVAIAAALYILSLLYKTVKS